MKKIVLLLLCAVLLGTILLGVLFAHKQTAQTPIENAGAAVNAEVKSKALTYQGQEYPLKAHLQTVLLIGTDTLEKYEEQTEGVKRFYNHNQADFLMLLALDRDAGTAQLIQLNRDTMTDVPWLDVLGDYGGTEVKQLCLAFNYGDGGRKSCENTVDAVSGLLFDLPIDNYIQIPMTAVGPLNDLVGGVPVTIEEDLTAVDPAFQAGQTLRLTGSQAEKFVRARMVLENDTNLARMKRQRAYMDSFQACAREAINTDSDFTMKLLETLSDFLQSDMTAQQLSDLVTQLDNADISPIRYADGKLLLGEKYYEFYPDQASLWEIVKAACCE